MQSKRSPAEAGQKPLHQQKISETTTAARNPPVLRTLDRFYSRWLAYTLKLAPGEALGLFSIRPGDVVEIVVDQQSRPARVIDTARVIAADREHFKTEDLRVFHRGGWPLFSGRKSPIRARRAGR